ncbi:MAG: glutaminyl-peptide cyclotransferase [Ginsengibacter sp.]
MPKKLWTILLSFLIVSCSNTNDDDVVDNSIIPINTSLPSPQPITFSVDAVYPHDTAAFTQGLQFYNGKLFESTGLPNRSTLRIVNIRTGVPEKKYLIPDSQIFGEGITIFKDKIYQLTWENNKIFVYNVNDILHPVTTLKWNYQGWGITNDGRQLIISDGSDKLYFIQPDETNHATKILKIISVANDRGAVDSLNELEYINGYVFANRWYNNEIVKIDTGNGHVVGRIDLTGLLQQYAPGTKIGDSEVLNGIAFDSTSKKMYITGKLWPKMFEIRLN